ncbi:MAG: Lrp/AsnC family transcriptional regulator [Desulfovibrio sp.]|jgi:DNA-binding Lrp family transcriptional regulator|nr:Lrp/AsnC family transcriptional regulator [Desulfovibrio sp.]
MDELDKRILNILQEDTRATNAFIGQEVGLSAAAVHGRIKRLEQRGIIRRFTVELDPNALQMQVLAFAQIFLQEMRRSEEAAAAFAKIPEVVEVHYTVGEACFLLKLRCPDTASLEHVLTNINDIPPVRATQTIIVLRSGKQQINPPLYVDEQPTLPADACKE